jgi:hypothetical protein
MLHVLGPSRYDDVAAIVGDAPALLRLRNAIDDALRSDAGGTYLYQSDGEGYSLAVVRVDDMYPVCTTYAGEINPQRSGRETVCLRSVPHFLRALGKASSADTTVSNIPKFLVTQQAISA